MRPEENPLDLNNFPDDNSSNRDINGKQVLEDGSSSSGGYRKKKNGGKDAKDDCGKVYECRFCSLKFCKSQALGGHMNRHRQERETETLNRARQLVYNNDNVLVQAPPHIGGQPIPPGAFHQASNLGHHDPTMPFRPPQVYPPTRLFSGSSSAAMIPPGPPQPPHHQPYMYTSPTRLVPFSSQYQAQAHNVNDYFVGHALPGTTSSPNNFIPGGPSDTNYTCIGAPVSRGPEGISGSGGSNGREGTLYPRFQDGF